MANCDTCEREVALDDNFCCSCGTELCHETIAIKYYFKQGYEYNTIVEFLCKFHGISMCVRTLKNRLKMLGLGRKSMDFNEQEVRERIMREIDGPGSMSGYRSMWHTLQREGYMVPRQTVEDLLKELDPEGCRIRRAKRLRRRVYVNPGPNYCWHLDGYDKLKPFGFPIHGCIDGFSRKMLWLQLSRSNNNPQVILRFFLNAVDACGGCPRKLRSDCGTENGLAAAAQCYFTNNEQAHIYGTSPHNQRIEGWWSYFRRSRANWWINFFKDLMEREVFTTGNDLEMECLWFCFSNLIQQDLDLVKHHWNTHYIRRSRHDTVPGRPDELFHLPEMHNPQDFLEVVNEEQCQQVLENYADTQEDENEHKAYFDYVMDRCGLSHPQDWREGLALYHRLKNHANGI